MSFSEVVNSLLQTNNISNLSTDDLNIIKEAQDYYGCTRYLNEVNQIVCPRCGKFCSTNVNGFSECSKCKLYFSLCLMPTCYYTDSMDHIGVCTRPIAWGSGGVVYTLHWEFDNNIRPDLGIGYDVIILICPNCKNITYMGTDRSRLSKDDHDTMDYIMQSEVPSGYHYFGEPDEFYNES